MSKIIPVFDFSDQPNATRMPGWIRQRLGGGQTWQSTRRAVHDNTLHTVCEEAACPNRGECWSRGTATFMLLGDTCTRACGFCNVRTGRPEWFDEDEPRRVAEAVMELGLDYVVLTSVNRDDLPDGGAEVFARTLIELRQRKPDIGVEFLTPDFKHTQDNAVRVIMAALDTVRSFPGETQLVWGHNVETVPALYREVRKGASYENSLALLEAAARQPGVEAKSAIMLGLGESEEEVTQVLKDLREVGVQRVSLGQYLRPTRYHVPVRRYLEPREFDDYARRARELGFAWVKAGPLVRSSYHAEEEQEIR